MHNWGSLVGWLIGLALVAGACSSDDPSSGGVDVRDAGADASNAGPSNGGMGNSQGGAGSSNAGASGSEDGGGSDNAGAGGMPNGGNGGNAGNGIDPMLDGGHTDPTDASDADDADSDESDAGDAGSIDEEDASLADSGEQPEGGGPDAAGFCSPNAASCDGSTLTLCNASGSAVYTQLCEDASGCKTAIPGCQRRVGYFTSLTDTVNVLADYLDLQEFYVDEIITVTHLALVSGSASNSDVKLALYSKNGGNPDALLAQTAGASSAVVGPVEIPVLAPVVLTPGSYYIGHVFESGTGVIASTASTLGYFWNAHDFGTALPSPYTWTGFDGAAKTLGQYVIGYSYRWSVDQNWDCTLGESCQDVYDFELNSGAYIIGGATAVTGASVVRLAAFAPGVALSGTNLLNGDATDRMCLGQDVSAYFELDTGATAGIYRTAIGRDYDDSAGLSGTYTFTLTSDKPFFPLTQSVNDVQTQLTNASCP